MMTSRPVLNNVYFPQNKLLKRPNLLQNGNNTLQKKKNQKTKNNCSLLQVAYQLLKGSKIIERKEQKMMS